MSEILRIRSISQFHKILGLPAPEHPLISFINENKAMQNSNIDDSLFDIRFATNMYAIMYKDNISGSLGYGRSTYDYQEGTLIFSSPGQVFTSPKKEELKGKEGWTLFFHPDLLLKSSMSNKIESYSYFSYEVTEALHLAPKEEVFISNVIKQIREEYSQNIDKHSQQLIISNLELLLNYCMRFYDRQFYTRSNQNSNVVIQFESKLKGYFNSEQLSKDGIPSAKFFGEEMRMSSNYLSDLLKKETGKGIKEHIDGHIIAKAKTVLLNSDQTINEIAFGLGFDYPQSFSRLFKKKTGISPNNYRSAS